MPSLEMVSKLPSEYSENSQGNICVSTSCTLKLCVDVRCGSVFIRFQKCDHVVSTLPDTPTTQNLLDAEALAHLSAHACFVNVGRGSVVDDDALMAALNRGSLAGAVLDVFDEEPLPDDSPLWDTPNLSITAHISAISHPLLLVPIFVENYQRFQRGETLKHIVDFEHGY